ncbi:NAD(P)-dependent oxidoreductase, partial [bacterium]|nr:NAD(P)-dependent oxidoreductase [bacterium]
MLVTGASGKVGKRLVKQLIEKGHAVRILIHKTKLEGCAINDVEMVKGNLIDPSSLESAVESVEIVCHMAAVFDIFPPYKYEAPNDVVYKFNVTGTYNLMEAIRKSGSVKHIIFGSSQSVYASDVREHKSPITEEEELFPGRFYSLTKILGEDMVRHYGDLHGIDFTILRFAWILDASDVIRAFEYETWEGMIAEGEREELARRSSKS